MERRRQKEEAIFSSVSPQPLFSSGEARAQETFPIKEEGRRRKGKGFGKERGNTGRNSYGNTVESANSSTLGDNAGGRGRRRISKRRKEGKKSLFVGESAKKSFVFSSAEKWRKQRDRNFIATKVLHISAEAR